MRALVIYESMYGNTHAIAECIAEGMSGTDVTAVPVHEAAGLKPHTADLIVVGAPTHVHGLPRPTSRRSAIEQAGGPDRLVIEPTVADTGVREWLLSLEQAPGQRAAAFDTRMNVTPLLSGRAARVIAQRLRRRGFNLLVPPESFLVDTHTQLLDGEADRARYWGHELERLLVRNGPSFSRLIHHEL